MTNKIANNYDVRLDKPIDIRYSIPTLSKQIDISVRYLGLIFYVEDTKLIYVYADTISTPIPFSDYLNRQNIYGAKVTDYSKILGVMKPYEKIGVQFTIFPLNVTYIFDGVNWNYHNGEYEVESVNIFNTIPKTLVGTKVKVNVKTPKKSYITLTDGTLSDEIIELKNDASNLIDNRFYSKNGNLYYCISGTLFNVGSKESTLTNFNIKNGKNKVTHNLKSKKLSVSLVSNTTDLISNIDHYIPIDENSFEFESYCDISDVTLIIKTV